MKKGLLVVFTFIISINCFANNDTIISNPSYILIKPTSTSIVNYSGDKQYSRIGQPLNNPIRVMVYNLDSTPAVNVEVNYILISEPRDAKNFSLSEYTLFTDSSGMVQNNVVLGSKAGVYGVIATIENEVNDDILYYQFTARESNWVFMIIIGLLGGLGLFLLGMNMMSEGLQKSAGEKMRSILSKLTHNRFIAFGVGTFVTMLMQSSSATTVMLVGFVNSKLMRFKQTIGIILGSAIGTTFTAQLIAFKITDYSLLMIGIGFLVFIIFKKDKIKNVGEIMLGFGILFFGMQIMSDAVYPLRTFDPFINALIKLENPLIGILIGASFTALIQSSGAFIGIMIILASQGLLTLEASIPLVIGSNIGTAITAILASLNTNTESKKVAIAHSLFKIIGTLIIIWWIPLFADIVKSVSPKGSFQNEGINLVVETLPRQIANAHTAFNIMVTLIILPFTNFFVWLIDKMIPKGWKEKEKSGTIQWDERFIKSPSLALNVAKQEAMKMSKLITQMLNEIIVAFSDKNKDCLAIIEQNEKEIDTYHDSINKFLIEVVQNNVNKSNVNEAFQIIHTVKEVEQIGDIISNNMVAKAEKWISSENEFSDKGKVELEEFHKLITKQFKNSISIFKDLNLEKAKAIKDKTKQYRNFAIELDNQHFKRLKKEVGESVSSSKMHLEIVGMLNAINSHISDIVRYFIRNN